MIISAIICAVAEALALDQRMQLPNTFSAAIFPLCSRGTCAETEDATLLPGILPVWI